jgi:hypothetical protein
MTDNEFTLFVFLGIFMLLSAFQQFRLVRLRRKIERIAEGGAMMAAPTVPADPEVEALRKRVQVLERIATDGNPRLNQEIEALRHAG